MARDYIDIMGPDGNAFALMASVKNILRQLGAGNSYIESVLDDMQSSDYDHLLQIVVDEIGDYIEIEGLEEYGFTPSRGTWTS